LSDFQNITQIHNVKDCAEQKLNDPEWNGMTQSGMELLRSGRKLTTKVGNNLGLSSCAMP